MSKKTITNSDLIFGNQDVPILDHVWIPENTFTNRTYLTYMIVNDVLISYVNDIIQFINDNHPGTR